VKSFAVVSTGPQAIVMEMCPSGGKGAKFEIFGSVSFRNPYGMLPAIYFGFLPFEGLRSFAFLLVLACFFSLLKRHRDKVLPLHYAIFFVVFVATLEAFTWFGAYLVLNVTGEPLCCPFGPAVVAAMCFQAIQQTATRTLLLTVALGFGLVRSALTIKETLLLLGLSLSYLAASVAATAQKVRSHNHLDKHNDSGLGAGSYSDVYTDAPALLLELIFLAWIYAALVNVTDLLRSQGQTYKLHMFTLLNYTIASFVGLTTILTGVVVVSKLGYFDWPWQLYWLQIVSLEGLNFAVIAAVCAIWRPTDRSMLLVMHDQLSTVDTLDDDDFDEEGGELELTSYDNLGGGGPAKHRPLAMHDEYDDDDEEDDLRKAD